VALAGNEIFWLTFAVQPAIDKVSLYNLSALPFGELGNEKRVGRENVRKTAAKQTVTATAAAAAAPATGENCGNL